MLILYYDIIFFGLLIIFVGEDVSAECLYGRCNISKKATPSTQNSLSVNLRKKSGLIDIHLPREVCDYTHFVKKVINPYSNQELPIPTSDFKSGCLQCAACLAIAQQINDTLQKLTFGVSDPVQEMKFISHSLNTLCNSGFYNYDLKNHEGYSLVFQVVNKNFDFYDKWPKKLREMCNKYVGQINIYNFHSNLLSNSIKLKDLFCRSDSVFRDCANVKYRTIPTTKQYINKKVIFKIECTL